QNARNRDNHTTKKGIFNTPWFAFLIICCIKSTSLNPDANSSRVPQGSAAAAVTNARGVAIDAHDMPATKIMANTGASVFIVVLSWTDRVYSAAQSAATRGRRSHRQR